MSALPDIDTSYSPDSGSIFFKIEQNGDKYSIFVHDVISSDEHEIYLVTETDISQVVDKQEMMHNYFQDVYKRQLILDSQNKCEFGRLKEIFENDSLQMVSFTITEKGYSLVNGKGEVLPDVLSDFESGADAPASYIGKVAALLYTRYLSGKKPVAMVSMDNCSHLSLIHI